jgi:hypothetical protein
VEVVPKGRALFVFLSDQSDNAVLTDGHKETAIFVTNGKQQRVPLAPAGENRLTGTSPALIPSEAKGVIQTTMPTGSIVQAKFN